MKRKDIIIYLTEKKEKSKADIVPLSLNCTVAIFSLCLLMDIFCFFHISMDNVLLEKILFVIMSGLALTFAAAMRFSFFSFIKLFAEKYKLLLILGIKTKDFWRLAVKEYFSAVFWLGIRIILISNAAGTVISYIVFGNNSNISIPVAIKQFLFSAILIFVIYTVILSFTMFAIIYNRQKKSLIDFFEHFSQDLSKEKKNEYGHIWKLVLGMSFFVLSFVLLIDFTVEKMILAIFLNLLGAFLFIRADGYLIRKILKRFKNIYYKRILIWADLIYQYKINSYVIFILYTLNFFLTYFMGGLIVSVDSGQDPFIKYPYETIIYSNSDSNMYSSNNYDALLVDVVGYGSATAISNDAYNHLMKTEGQLGEGDILFFDEREKEAGMTLTEKEIIIISKGQDGNYLDYHVEDVEWKVIFGQNVFQELNGIVVFNNKDFNTLLENKAGEQRKIFLSEQALASDSLQLGTGEKYWNRTRQIEKERTENRVIIILIYMISLILILEGQAFIFTKQIVNSEEERYRYQILKQLGIEKRNLEKIIERKISGSLVIPGVLAIISGLLFFAMDLCQESSGFTLSLLLKYGIVILSLALIQIFGCCIMSRKIKKMYMIGY